MSKETPYSLQGKCAKAKASAMEMAQIKALTIEVKNQRGRVEIIKINATNIHNNSIP